MQRSHFDDSQEITDFKIISSDIVLDFNLSIFKDPMLSDN